jgi:GrpB-like predicted nucleotidyltransferase (UPF0157 family)
MKGAAWLFHPIRARPWCWGPALPVGKPYGYRGTDSRRRHYEKLSAWPERFVVLGDSFLAPSWKELVQYNDMNDSTLGLKHGVNLLVDYDPQWPDEFAAEKQRLQAALGDIALGIEHYGSTSVPGLRAKPILDIMVGVRALEDWVKCKAPLEALGYDYAAHAGIPNDFVFGRGRDRTERTHLVHVVEYGGEQWRNALAFRDALRADPALAAEYAAIKQQAVEQLPVNRARYTDFKAPFVAAVLAR